MPEKIINDIPFILYVGSREKYKNFEFLIKGYSKSKRLLSSVNIVLFGGGKLKRKEKNLIYQLKIDENKIIQFDGNDSDLKNLYKKAKAFVFPSLYEGFGLPLLESLENNCPIACSDIPVFREILNDNAFYFNPESYESLISSLENAIFTKKEIEIKRKYESLKNKFSWSKCSIDTLNLYKNIIG